MYYAHSTERPDKSNWQILPDHLREVVALAMQFGDAFGAARAAALAGWLHDLGKYAEKFKLYIDGKGKSCDHSTAGAVAVLELVRSGSEDGIMGELVAYGIAGHHAGLPDRTGGSGSSLNDRLKKKIPIVDPIWKTEVKMETSNLVPVNFSLRQDENRPHFQLALLGRMIFSCLVDADFLDTEEFYARVAGTPIDRKWPNLPGHTLRLISRLDAYMNDKIARLSAVERDAPLNVLRGKILAHVRNQATMPKGVFTLDVPTGGGKTLASLAFALDHARTWGMTRIVYAAPFTSIIDQTAQVFRDALGDDIVLEHHSQIDTEKDLPEELLGGKAQSRELKLRRAMENWAAPVIVTTNVQLFESLFSHRPSRCRKLHNLANAVIVLDEAQTLPLHVLRPCVVALDELARNYGCTIVLCTATQPALKAPGFRLGFETSHELAPEPAELHTAFERVTFKMVGTLSDAALIEELRQVRQGLVIVNSRKHAHDLYLTAKDAQIDGLIHLTTRQIAKDRAEILKKIRQDLKHKRPCIVIATSLIEAGVDVSFPRVWRAEAGLDQIIQAAGRCNREWEQSKETALVVVFQPSEAKPPRVIEGFARAMHDTARACPDLFTKPGIERYFNEVYWKRTIGADHDGLDAIPMPNLDGKKVPTRCLAQFAISGGETDFSYRKVGENFKLIQEGMAPIIVATNDEARATLQKLRVGRITAGGAARELQRYMVQVPPRYRQQFIDNGHAEYVPGFDTQFAVLKDGLINTPSGFYSREQGLLWEKADELGIEGNMI